MVKQVELTALKVFTHSVGSIDIGERFRVSETFARSLIEEGIAQLDPIARTPGTWAGSTAVVMASGPSLCAEDIDLVERWRYAAEDGSRRVVVVNSTFLSAPWADVLYAADLAWWKVYIEQVRAIFKGELWSQHDDARKLFGVKHIQSEQRPGLSRIPRVIHNGGNSGYQAMGLVHEFGAARQVLLGFDMQKTAGRSHHHGDHPAPLRRSSPYDSWMRNFKSLASDMKVMKVRVINASRETALKEFDRMPLAAALNEGSA